ncbi:MAG: transcription termination/antitermination protein NusA [Candidatus Portnoybacteria bacterium CG10_big_fil_rev_8_21_14_0_10_36_7]|uniref:Transcription termination/antitermination protein NusA n=1 Tax=Candidatus Portnoybacteria bacterium CG10_big_fil_rev_8_21_14_0_10_36_7 TaxID=1974812 RepID=A0A2M8KER9_9BACT|nr:MAG: transcription termination/antitermination protein NusA [Candidatus Portnoybacteria bacterium CG10_big_fil_rev_8_21_14_0_10_36_7]
MEKQHFLSAIDQICEEKGISREKVMETIEMAIAAAYKKDYGKKGQNIRAKFDLTSGESEIFLVKLVVDESMLKPELAEGEVEEVEEDTVPEEEKKIRFNEERHIMLADAKKIKESIKVGEELIMPLEAHKDFGRIAAQTAKQVIIQRLREAERDAVYEEYQSKEGDVLSGTVQRVERGNSYVDLGRTIGVMYPEEQVRGEFYRIGQRLRVYVLAVQKDVRGPAIILSRAYPKMVSKLFELEVPEIASGIVTIHGIAREAGNRTKIAVSTIDEKIDPIGACVGQKGSRVLAVINELGGEKIDIILYDENPIKFIGNSLSPAKIQDVEVNQDTKNARVTVAEDQLSLAIGKEGQNVRLAAKLTGWRIDVISGEGVETSVDGQEAEDSDAEENEEPAEETNEKTAEEPNEETKQEDNK